MTEVKEICKRFGSKKRKRQYEKKSPVNEELSFPVDIGIPGSNCDNLNTTDNILGMVTNLLMSIQKPKLNLLLSNCQTEPLDLSLKQPLTEKSSESASLPKRFWKPKTYEFDKFFSAFIKRYTANDVCNARCEMLYKDHYHCFAENGHCTDVMKGKDQLRQHGKRHSIAEELTKSEFSFCVGCPSQKSSSHFHCRHNECEYISIHISNMERLIHFESTHCVINSKKTDSDGSILKQYCSAKQRKKLVENNKKCKVSSVVDQLPPLSPVSSLSSDNQFIDFNPNSLIETVNKNNCLSILDRLSPERMRKLQNNGVEELDASILLKIKEYEKNFYRNGSCSRLFCNLKKGNHYHCPICDRGSSKKDLYVRHLMQRHK